MSLPSADAPGWARRLPVHYGWVVAGVGVLIVMCCLGIARFAFGMLLPSMGASLALSYAEMGVIGTSNFIGYLVGALVCGSLTVRWGVRRVVVAALGLIAGSLLVVASCTTYPLAAVAFTVTGFGSGLGNVGTMGLLSQWFLRSVRGRAAGLVVGGIGLGVVVNGLVIPPVNRAVGATDGWRASWRLFAVLIALVGVAAAVVLRNHPRQVGASAVGRHTDVAGPPAVPGREQLRTTVRLGGIYFMFGFSYVIYVTFIVTTLVRERGFGEAAAGWFWAAVGLLSMASGFLGALSDRIGRKASMALAFGMHTIAFLLVGLGLPDAMLYLSIGFFGLAAWSVPGIMGAVVGDYLPPGQAVRALGVLTVVFGAGQALGPVVAGVLADRTGSFSGGYLAAAAAAALGVFGSLTIPQPGEPARS